MLGVTPLRAACLLIVTALCACPAGAVDLEAFEFNDSNGTLLPSAANSVNPGNNWTSANDDLSEVTGGVYQIIKESDGLATHHLQIDNVASGSVYLVARMSGWAFRQNSVDDAAEEVRFGFLNEDTGVDGNTITAEMRIQRTGLGGIQLSGRALGTGGTTISETADLAVDQTSPFTAVLAVDLDADTYKVYYKDGSNASQFLGQGAVSSLRAANSVRLAANNFFADGNFYPILIEERFDIDRIAVATTNPLTDLGTVSINRTTGALTLVNNTGQALTGLESVSIESAAGGLDPSGWKSITGNYDLAGDDSVDADGNWAVDDSTPYLLAESALDANGGALGVGQSVVLNNASDAVWLQSPMEDVTVKLNFAGGVTRSADVTFTGNGGARFQLGDLNFDGQLTVDDWTVLIASSETSLAGLSPVQAYRQGDLDGDGVSSIQDIGVFKSAFDAANGAGAFSAMVAGVPEPAAALLCGVLGLLAGARRRALLLTAVMMLGLAASNAQAVILEDFGFGDSNGTLLVDAENSANLGNSWNEDGTDMAGSAIQNGVYRIQKNNDGFGTNYLDIANVSTGKLWMVAEIAGWSFSSIAGPAEFDSGELEEVRFGFLNNDSSNQGGSEIVSQMAITRTSDGGLTIYGAGGGTATNFTFDVSLPLVQNDPYTMVLEYDGDNEMYSIYSRTGTGAFELIGTRDVVETARAANSVRMVVNNNFSGTGEFFDLDRLYITNETPITDVVDPLTLRVNTTTGQAWIVNDSTEDYTFDSYRIASSTNSLRPGDAFWSSLSDNATDAVDGDDPGSTAGDGVGETWDEAGGADAGVLAESFLLGATTLAAGQMIGLGSPVTPGGSPDIAFQFRRADTGAVIDGLVEFVSGGLIGDYNADGVVDAADYTVWRDTLGQSVPVGTGADGDGDGQIDQGDYVAWRSNYGLGSGASAAVDAAPEPLAAALALIAAAQLTMSRRRFT
ncbi:hypothetical protein KOR34_37920 [Posidoniimonas corsicana]|uniref:Dockerin domain-containing protein n=1 Tax=Posidoniimonas corsicana TaxID=1938618 RepID=A0A5C5V5Z5_9BACT|nr:hypothetical protein [Posidoniimonas corsicana]TWT33956.1 hypothetical protein KOR34_37920 [Posidoniimonas corsicana]